jgi:hypothetical protein
MTKSRRHSSLYNGMDSVKALKLSVALEEAILLEIRDHIRGGDFGDKRGWNRFVDKGARRVRWSALEDRESRHHFVELVSYTLDDLASQDVLRLSLGS